MPSLSSTFYNKFRKEKHVKNTVHKENNHHSKAKNVAVKLTVLEKLFPIPRLRMLVNLLGCKLRRTCINLQVQGQVHGYIEVKQIILQNS